MTKELSGRQLDVGILTVKATDNRFKAEDVASIKWMTNFFENIKPSTTWLCITHCDQVGE